MPDNDNDWNSVGGTVVKIIGGLVIAAVVLVGLVMLTCGGMLVFS
ncbi:MAG TPA: hypothetical protein VF846_07850 [Thermoanaerobaculia bacterium]|jgi:hypothetical protein